MTGLVHQRCFHHAEREAAVRCLDCGRFYCRECVTEHGGRLICAACLRRVTQGVHTRRSGVVVVRLGSFILAVLLVWGFFYTMGRVLLAIPSAFHEGTVWTRALTPGE